MNDSWEDLTSTPLYQEHLLLGARYDSLEDWIVAAPATYGALKDEQIAHREGCALCDLSGMSNVLVSGEGAPAFVNAAVAKVPTEVGACHFAAVVAGDGTVTAIPLVARTGDTEYLVCDPSPRGMALLPWLSFLANIEQKGFRPFAGAHVEDVSSSLVPLLLWGPQATAVIGDYVAQLSDLPQKGQIRQTQLDRITCLVAAPDLDENPSYLVFAPPQAARALWRSFLSFPVVTPIGHRAFARSSSHALPWIEALLAEGQLKMALSELLESGLVRPEGGYVGARGLTS